MLRKFIFGDSGQGTGEYAVIAGLVIVGGIVAFSYLAQAIRTKLTQIGSSIGGVDGATQFPNQLPNQPANQLPGLPGITVPVSPGVGQ